MDKNAPERELRRLLCLRDNAWATGDAGQFESLDKQVSRFRDECRANLEEHAAVLRALLERQRQLMEAISAGKIKPVLANAENRRLTQEMEAQRAAIARFNLLARAQSPGELPDDQVTIQKTLHDNQESSADAVPATGRLSRRDKRQIGAALIILVVAVALTAYLLVGKRAVRFEAAGIPGDSEMLRFSCINGTLRPVTLCVPGDLLATSLSPGTVCVDVHLRDSGAETFHLASGFGGCWTQQGVPLSRNEPILIGPGLSTELRLHIPCLRERFPEANALRIVCTLKSGKTVYQFPYALNTAPN